MATSVHTAAPGSNTGIKVGYWLTTSFFVLFMLYAAYGYLTAPAMAAAFAHLGYPQYFRVELAIAKILGCMALVLPVPGKVREWAYAGFGIVVVSAFIAHMSVGDGVSAWSKPLIALAILIASYVLYNIRNGRDITAA